MWVFNLRIARNRSKNVVLCFHFETVHRTSFNIFYKKMANTIQIYTNFSYNSNNRCKNKNIYNKTKWREIERFRLYVDRTFFYLFYDGNHLLDNIVEGFFTHHLPNITPYMLQTECVIVITYQTVYYFNLTKHMFYNVPF